jgi:hypothetical protein
MIRGVLQVLERDDAAERDAEQHGVADVERRQHLVEIGGVPRHRMITVRLSRQPLAAEVEHDDSVPRCERVDILPPEVVGRELQPLQQHQRPARAALLVPDRNAVAEPDVRHQKFADTVTP